MKLLLTLLLPLLGLLFCGCPADQCYGNNDCIDGYACTKEGSCIEVDPLAITGTTLPNAVVGESYQVTLAATGGIEPYRWTIATDEIWLSMQATTGVLVGSPPGPPETVTVDVTVTDDSYDGQNNTVQFSIEILNCEESSQDQCSGHGNCSAGACTCVAGYTGSQCGECDSGYHLDDNSECVADVVCGPNSCSGSGDCDDSTGEVVCTCYDGYTGDTCSECASGYHDDGEGCVKDEVCLENTCSGHGECDDSSGEVVCTCDLEYGGEFCDTCIWFTCMQQVKLVPTNPQESLRFGNAVSIGGDFAVVGAANDDTTGSNEGGVYVFKRTGVYSWDSVTRLDSPDLGSHGQFGFSVSICGDYLVVGAIGASSDTGAAYVFYRTGENRWDSVYTLEPGDLAAGDWFGYAVDIDEDSVIVAAPRTGVGETSGAAYVFKKLGINTWDSRAKIVSPDPQVNDGFADSVSIDGDFAVVGSQSTDSNVGAIIVYERLSDNSWGQGVKIVPPGVEEGALFGGSVSINGDFIIVGASALDIGGFLNSGAAYVFRRLSGNSWDSGFQLIAPDVQEIAQFGLSVDISDYYVLVGARGADSVKGAAYVYRRVGENVWDSGTKISANDGQLEDQFGGQVSISGTKMIISAVFHDSEANDAGAAYAY